MAKVKIDIEGDHLQTTVNGVKGASCTDVTKLLDGHIEQFGGEVTAHEQTAEYHEEELVVENVGR